MSPAVSSWSNGGKRRAARVLIPLMPQGDNDSLLTLAHWLAEAQVPVMLVGIVPVPEGENLTVGAAAARELRKRIQAHVDRVYLRAKARIRVTYTPWDDLRMVALRERVDMLVLDWPRHLEVLQLTAAELLSHPPADILLLRGPLRTPPQRILIPNRGGPHAELALRLALLLSRQFGSRVTSLRLRSEEPDHQEDLDFAGMRQILQAMPDVRQETLASDDKPAALVEAARGYDLVIVGTAARPTASTTSFGAIADRLLADAPCPVLAVKTRRVALEREDPRRFGAHAISVLVDRWFAENTFHSDEFADLKRLVRLKEERGVTISLALPALNEEETIGPIIRTCQRALMEQVPLLDEIVLMDSNSTDRTREIAQDLGIPVYIHQQVLPQYGAREGKGEALWKSLYVTKGDLIIWVDTDIRNFHPRFVYGLIGALLYRTKLMLVKGFYRRPLKTGQGLQPGRGGRVTELTARPLINLFFPELSGVIQPLAGEYGGRREALERIPFSSGYGVEMAVLIGILEEFGLSAIAQVDLVERIHRNQSLTNLSKMAFAIIQTVMGKLERRYGLKLLQDINRTMKIVRYEAGQYFLEVEEIAELERPPMIALPEYRARRGLEASE